MKPKFRYFIYKANIFSYTESDEVSTHFPIILLDTS
jgi:hypothetical protein